MGRFINKISKAFFGKRLLEQKIDGIEQQLQEMKHYQKYIEQLYPKIVVERIYVDKIEIEKFDLNNNIGALGVKELGGTLNIGANYGFNGANLPEELKKLLEGENNNAENGNNKKDDFKDKEELKVNIRGKKQKG